MRQSGRKGREVYLRKILCQVQDKTKMVLLDNSG